MKAKSIIISLLAVLAFTSCSEESKVSYQTAKVEKQDISTTITATGTIEPVTKVEVGTQVSGIIDKIYVDYNSTVHKGQVIAELDKTNLLSELASAKSNLANAQSDLNYQKSNFSRYQTLYKKGLISANDFENARLTYEQAQQKVKIQQQTVQKAQTNLGYATITSPIDGVILSKEVEEGQTVAAAMSTPTLFYIAQDLTNMRVIADIDEADIGGVVEGQRVEFTVDAYPDDTFEGQVTQVRQNATTESNVVTYEVVISAPNDDLKLKPGLTANVTIYTLEKNGVLAVPNKALRFTPNEAIMTKDQKVEDVKADAKVWTLEGNTFKAHAVTAGTTNGTYTEISGIAEGTEVLTDFSMEQQADDSSDSEASNPFMPSPPGKKNSGSKSDDKSSGNGGNGGAPAGGK